jgi:heptosyltransferase-2
MATPALRAIRNGMPEISELCLVGRYAPLTVLEGCPWVDSTLVYKPKSKSADVLSRRGMIQELKRRRIETIILFPNSLSAGMIGYLTRAKRRIGYARDGRRWLLTDPIPMRSESHASVKQLPTIDYYLNIARYLGCDIYDRSMQLWVSDADRDQARSLFDSLGLDWDQPTIVLNTASATGDTRQWPTGHASRAARELANRHGLQVLIHSGPGDRQKANAIAFGADHPAVQSMGMLADLPLGLSRGVLERAAVVVSTDSGPRHMAAALNKPVIALFGPTAWERYQTYNRPETILRLALDCGPCGKRRCPLVHNNCMAGLSYHQVVSAVLDHLNRDAIPHHTGESPLVPRTAA